MIYEQVRVRAVRDRVIPRGPGQFLGYRVAEPDEKADFVVPPGSGLSPGATTLEPLRLVIVAEGVLARRDDLVDRAILQGDLEIVEEPS